MFEVLLSVVLDLSCQVCLRLLGQTPRLVRQKHNVPELSCTGDRGVKPLAVDEEEPPVEDRYLVVDGGSLK